MKSSALIGFTGFVGGNLKEQHQFSDLFNSKNIQDIVNHEYDMVACAGARSEKWLINQNPEEDLNNIKYLIKNLKKIRAKKFILISTVDVYPHPVDVDEDTKFNPKDATSYGENRYFLERFCLNNFDALVVRLPGLFGKGIKKNAVYDLLNNHMLDKIHCNSVYQFYYLKWLWKDISKVLKHNIRLINFATKPTSIKEITRDCFGIPFDNRPKDIKPGFYNFKTKHYRLLGGRNGYLYQKGKIKKALKEFVKLYKT